MRREIRHLRRLVRDAAAREDVTGFLGVQVQVALNNVQGTDYPYLYAVVLGKGEFVLPSVPARRTANDVDTVFDPTGPAVAVWVASAPGNHVVVPAAWMSLS